MGNIGVGVFPVGQGILNTPLNREWTRKGGGSILRLD